MEPTVEMIERPYFESGDKTDEIRGIIAEFALCMNRGDTPDSSAAQSAAEKWRKQFGDTSSADDVYGTSYDFESYGAGTADYMNDAIAFFRRRNI